MEISLNQELSTGMIQRMQMGMQMSIMLEKPGEDFWNTVREIENSDIFIKLHQTQGRGKVISIIPVKRFIPVSSDLEASPAIIDKGVDLDGFEDVVEKVKSMGAGQFRHYFLEEGCTDAELSEMLSVPVQRIRLFRRNIIDRVQIIDTFSDNGERGASPVQYSSAEVVAQVHISDNKAQIDFARHRTRYRINEEKLSQIFSEGNLDSAEMAQFKNLRRQIDWINFRFDLLYRVVHLLVEKQLDYLNSGQWSRLRILEEKKLAEALIVDPSWISRLIRGKYIKCRERLIKLRDLFISKRELVKRQGKEMLAKILDRQDNLLAKGIIKRPYSDQAICNLLLGESGTEISRRSINNWRREIEKERKNESSRRRLASGGSSF